MPVSLPLDYAERVYAGVLGKIIGVYLGRPFETWSYERLTERFGEVDYYVHEQLKQPLIVTDDDISGTFTFLRALPDHGNDPDLTPAQIGQTWLNYIIENRSILWWGGMGVSTEHSAYLRLKHGIAAPESGSAARNGTVVSEQIGSQIFIDGWGMVAPGDPERAVDLARRAASVSHDGEAIYGAQVVAAMVSAAFVESDIDKLIDTAISLIPADCVIRRMVADVRHWHRMDPEDWRASRARIAEKYGYDKFGGGCHMVPNHALIIHALLHGNGDFSRSLMIVNTCGWDTDCNSGNVACLLGVRGGVAAIDKDKAAGKDWRGPVADRLYLPTADGARCITDAVQEAYRIVDIGRALAGEAAAPLYHRPRFSFAFPGSVQGFRPHAESSGISNEGGALQIRYSGVTPDKPARVLTATCAPKETWRQAGYTMISSPTLYPGQTIMAKIRSEAQASARLVIEHYDGKDGLTTVTGPATVLPRGQWAEVTWQVPVTDRQPIASVGVDIIESEHSQGVVLLNSLTWYGTVHCDLHKPSGGTAWQHAWVDGVTRLEPRQGEPGFKIVQNEGNGMITQGAREWTRYHLTADIRPHLADRFGIAVRVQGLQRYYALMLTRSGKAQLIKALDGEAVLAEKNFEWKCDESYQLDIAVAGSILRAGINGKILFEITDKKNQLDEGAIGIVCDTPGNLLIESVQVRPVG